MNNHSESCVTKPCPPEQPAEPGKNAGIDVVCEKNRFLD